MPPGKFDLAGVEKKESVDCEGTGKQTTAAAAVDLESMNLFIRLKQALPKSRKQFGKGSRSCQHRIDSVFKRTPAPAFM
jgi:hypothetical protein